MILRGRAPVRIDFAGGWTDVQPYPALHGGAVVNAAISLHAYSTLHTTMEGVNFFSVDYGLSVQASHVRHLEYDGSMDLVKAALKRLPIDCGIDLVTRSDAPPGSGLGSSAAMGVVLLGLLSHYLGQRLLRQEIAELAHQLEVEELHIHGGKQDQYAAVIGGINSIEFGGDVDLYPLHLKPQTIYELEKHLILCYTKQSRLSGKAIEQVINDYQRGNAGVVSAFDGLKQVADLTSPALLNGDLPLLGELLSENWHYQKLLHPSISTFFMDDLYDTAMENGAIGGKACGAGAGGTMLFLADADREHEVKAALEKKGGILLPFHFDFTGLQIWSG